MQVLVLPGHVFSASQNVQVVIKLCTFDGKATQWYGKTTRDAYCYKMKRMAAIEALSNM